MPAAFVALPTGGNPAATSALIDFQLPDSAGAGKPTVLSGYSISESTGTAAAKVRLRDGSSATAPELTPLIEVAAAGATGVVEFPNGCQVTSGEVFLEVVSGSVEAVVYWGGWGGENTY